MKHKSDQFDRRANQEEINDEASARTNSVKTAQSNNGLPQESNQSEITLKSLVSSFIWLYIFFLVFFEMIAFLVALLIRANGLILFILCLTGLVFAFLVAFYFGQKEITKENEYKELYSQFVSSAIFFAFMIALIPFTIYFGLCAVVFS